MQNSHRQSTFHIYIACVGLMVFCSLLFSSCAQLPIQNYSQVLKENEHAPIYSIVCIVHGDNNYIYHDTTGNKLSADKETINELFKNISNLSSHRQDLIIDLSNNVFDYNIINVIINLLEKTYFVKVHLDSSCKGNMKNQKFKSLTNIIFKN